MVKLDVDADAVVIEIEEQRLLLVAQDVEARRVAGSKRRQEARELLRQ